MTMPDHVSARERFAVAMLLVCCAFWGMSFNWNKQAQRMLGRDWVTVSGNEALAGHGPATFLAVRFPLATLAWAALFPRSLRGWTKMTVRGGTVAGFLLSTGMLFQHYGLAYTSESLSAFLTSLTIIFTPIAASVFLKHRISAGLWCAIGLATAGVAFMTLYREEGRFEIGALLGLLCAVIFSGHILVVDAVGKREDPWRFTLVQLAAASLVFMAYAGIRFGQNLYLSPSVIQMAFSSWNFVELTIAAVFPATLVTFGLMFRYQPQTTPTRAALVYLTEPLFATGYAWAAAGRAISGGAWVGAALIVLGNLLAERFGRRGPASDMTVAPLATAFDR